MKGKSTEMLMGMSEKSLALVPFVMIMTTFWIFFVKIKLKNESKNRKDIAENVKDKK